MIMMMMMMIRLLLLLLMLLRSLSDFIWSDVIIWCVFLNVRWFDGFVIWILRPGFNHFAGSSIFNRFATLLLLLSTLLESINKFVFSFFVLRRCLLSLSLSPAPDIPFVFSTCTILCKIDWTKSKTWPRAFRSTKRKLSDNYSRWKGVEKREP